MDSKWKSAGITGKILHVLSLCITQAYSFGNAEVASFMLFSKDKIDGGSSKAKRQRVSSSFESENDLTADVASIKSGLHNAMEEIKAARAEVKDIIKIKNADNIPIPLQEALIECLKCKICMEIAKLPVIFGKCCQQLLGCQGCIDTWFGENSFAKKYINCRAERAVTQTCLLWGMDSLLTLVGSVLEPELPSRVDDSDDEPYFETNFYC